MSHFGAKTETRTIKDIRNDAYTNTLFKYAHPSHFPAILTLENIVAKIWYAICSSLALHKNKQ